MAKRLLVNVLLDVFGDYVEGFTEENLQIGVWSGKLSLHNLALNRDTFQKLALPVSIHHGTVRDFEVTIPWTQLESQPVKVEINGVYLQAGPLSTETLDPDEIERRLFESKQQKLEQLERRLDEQKQADDAQGDKKAQDPGWVQRLTTTIIDNLIVTVRNIHIRYEDSTTYPGITFAAGLTLDSFLVRSTDANWLETFIVRDKSQRQASIRKLAALSNLAVYWNPSSEDMQHMSFEPWLQRMSMLIYSSGRNDAHLQFLLNPVSMRLKLVHNEVVAGDTPKFDLLLESSDISSEISTTQFEQLLQTQESLAKLERYQRFFPFRPRLRPNEDPRAWWHYAFKFVINKPPSILSTGLAAVVQTARLRREYVPLFKRSKGLDWLPALTDIEKTRIRDIEMLLPIETLLLFRKLAKQELYREERERGLHAPKKQGLFSRLVYGKQKEKPEPNEISIEELQAQAAQLVATEAHPHLFALRLGTSTTLRLKVANRPIAEASMAMQLEVDKRDAMDVRFTVQSMTVTDCFSPSPVFPNLVSVRQSHVDRAQAAPLLELTVHAAEQTHVSMKALPIEIVLNQPCIQQLMGFTKGVTIDTSQIAQALSATVSEEDLKKVLGSTSISIDFAAPKIIIPQDYSTDGGLLLLDCGNIAVDGQVGIGNLGAMRWDVRVTHIQAGMPNFREEVYTMQETSYLIKPFDVIVGVQTVDTSESDMTVRCRIEPEVRGLIDAPKLSRLLQVVDVVVATFTTEAPPVPDPLVSIMHQQFKSGTVDLAPMFDSSSPLVEEVQPLRKKIDILAMIPAIVLELQYDPEVLSSLCLSVRSLEAAIGVRPYDTLMQFDLAQLEIEDSERHESQRYLASSPEEAKLLQVGYNVINNRKSPLYQGFGTLLDANFKTLNLNIDSQTISHLQPFFHVLLGHGSKAPVAAEQDTDTDAAQQATSATPTPSTESAALGVKGMQVRANLGSVSLEIFDKPLFQNKNAVLNSVLQLNLKGITSAVEMLDTTHARVQLQAFEVMDSRRSSSHHAYKHLVAPKAGNDELTEQKPLLDVDYQEQGGGVALVKIDLEGFLSYISLDLLMTTINIALENTTAVLQLLAAPAQLTPVDLTARKSAAAQSPPQPQAQRSTLNVQVILSNPRIILLEDPARIDSSGIVANASFNVSYVQDMTGDSGTQKVQVSVQGLESFVLANIQDWKPLQIIQPLVLEALMENVIDSGVTLITTVNVDADDLEARVSMSDLLLVLDILQRATLVDQGPERVASSAPQLEATETEPTLAPTTQYKVKFAWERICITGINDFDGQAIPVISANLRAMEFSLTGPLADLHGGGKFTIWSNFFNPELAIWEPILEPWTPKLDLETSGDRLDATVEASDHLQLNVTGICLRTLTATAAMFLRINDRTQRAHEHAPYVIKNETGYDFVLQNSTTAQIYAPIHDGEQILMNPNSRATREVGIQKILFDLRPAGALAEEREPVRRLQGSRTNETIVILQPIHGGDAIQYAHPVVEDVWELQRYDPMRRTWKDPFLPTDPTHWTDVSFAQNRPKGSIEPPARWSWQDEWHVDMSGQVGKDTDEEGWDYAVDFSALDRNRKGKQGSFDFVRRRRWLRTRGPAPPALNDPSRLLNVVWDVQSLETGRKVIRIRSTLQVKNNLPFPVTLSLSHPSWNEQFEFGPLAPEQLFSVPVKFVYATGVQFRRSDVLSAYSETFSTVKSISDSKVNHRAALSTGAGGALQMIVQRTMCNGQLCFVLEPLGCLVNWLPCALTARLQYSDGQEEVTLVPGEQFKLVRGDPRNGIRMALKVGHFAFSDFVPFRDPDRQYKRRTVDMSYPGSTNADLSISIKNHLVEDTGLIDCIVMSKFIMVDRTGLQLAVKGKQGSSNGYLVRNTFKTDNASESKMEFTASSFENVDDTLVVQLTAAPVGYQLAEAAVGKPVYTDRNFVWTYLPEVLNGCQLLSTPNSNKHTSSEQLVTLSVSKATLVFVLVDIEANRRPKWMANQGYRSLGMKALARRQTGDCPEEITFQVFAKVQRSAGELIFGGNRLPGADNHNMYTVITKEIHSLEEISSILEASPEPITEDEEDSVWADGGRGLTMFCAQDREFSVGILKGRAWSDKLPLPSTDLHIPSTFSVQHAAMEYLLCYRLETLPGSFARTQKLTVMPRFCIVNLMTEAVKVRCATGSSVVEEIRPFDTIPWHRLSESGDNTIVFQCAGSRWTNACVDISEVGSFELLLPSDDNTPKVIHVEVKVAEPTEDCAVAVLIWQSVTDQAPTYQLTNRSLMPMTVRQPLSGNNRSIAFTVRPSETIPFGWLDLTAHEIEVVPGVGFSNAVASQVVRIDFDEPNQIVKITAGQAQFFASVLPLGSSKVLTITSNASELQTALTPEQRLQKMSEKSTKVRLVLNSIGVSLIAERPTRRELFTCQITGVSVAYAMTASESNGELVVNKIQIDNHIRETRIFPTLLAVAPQKKDKDTDPDQPLLHATFVQRVMKGTATPVFDYVAFRMLELTLQVDWESIEVLGRDFLSEIKLTTRDESEAQRNPLQWIRKFSRRQASSEHDDLVNLRTAKAVAQASRLYFDHILIHPMKVTLSFVNTSTGETSEEELSVLSSMGGNAFTFIQSLATVDRSPIHTSSFETRHVLDSPYKIAVLMFLHNKLFIMAQLASIAGSLAIIGSPATLLRNVGSGVSDFVYEPYEGLVESPMGFVRGIGRGSRSLVSGVVTSALNSAAGIINSASTGIAMISADSEYSRMRQLERQRQAASRKNVVEGMKDGGSSIARGIAGGITGLFTTPIKEAKKDGAVGFMKGVGKGILGVAVKPVLGVTDGVSAFVQGMSNSLGSVEAIEQLRPARPLIWQLDINKPVLKPLDMDECAMFHLMLEDAQKHDSNEGYMISLATEHGQVVISTQCIRIVLSDAPKPWRKPWEDIEYAEVTERTIRLNMAEGKVKNISFNNTQDCITTYSYIAHFSHKMSRPNDMVRPETLGGANSEESESAKMHNALSVLSGYRFGAANTSRAARKDFRDDNSLLAFAQATFLDAWTPDDWPTLDRNVWDLVNDWDHLHSGLQACRCCCLLIVNKSNLSVHLASVQLSDGLDVRVLSGPNYDVDARSILPGGWAVVFGWAYPPSPMRLGHVKVDVDTTAFNATFGSKRKWVTVRTRDHVHATYNEKSISDWWSKFTIVLAPSNQV